MTLTQEQKTHHLKIYPEHFSAVLTGVKRAELRKNDRDFKVGDTLHLMETPKGSCLPTGEFVNAVVTHIADVGDWLPGYVLLSIEREPAYTAPSAPVVPDGYAMVPVEPTEGMVIAGFEAELREEFRDPDAWETYEGMSGCEQAALRAKWCWAAMVKAAPQQE